jgi:hypothetical protein
MKVAVFSTKSDNRTFLEAANAEYRHEEVHFNLLNRLRFSILESRKPW